MPAPLRRPIGVAASARGREGVRFEKKLRSTNSSSSVCAFGSSRSNWTPIPLRASLHATVVSASISRAPPGRRNRTRSRRPTASGVIVRSCSPPLLTLALTADAMTLSIRSDTVTDSATRGLARRLKLSGNRWGARADRMWVGVVYSLMKPLTL
jgi:hypothetical protein